MTTGSLSGIGCTFFQRGIGRHPRQAPAAPSCPEPACRCRTGWRACGTHRCVAPAAGREHADETRRCRRFSLATTGRPCNSPGQSGVDRAHVATASFPVAGAQTTTSPTFSMPHRVGGGFMPRSVRIEVAAARADLVVNRSQMCGSGWQACRRPPSAAPALPCGCGARPRSVYGWRTAPLARVAAHPTSSISLDGGYPGHVAETSGPVASIGAAL